MAGPVFIEGCIELLFALVEAAQQQRAKVQVPDPVGAQWELRRALARTDRRFGHYDPAMRAHVDRDLSQVDLPSGCSLNENRQ